MARFVALLGLLLAIATPASAQNCKKGIPCGNSCIAATRTCRVGQGTARAAPGSPGAKQPAANLPPQPAGSVPSSAGVKIPEDAVFVASVRGEVYYLISPACTAWRDISPANLRWYKSSTDAVGAGLRASTIGGCS